MVSPNRPCICIADVWLLSCAALRFVRVCRVIRTMPTIGFNMETVVYKNLQFNVWDLGQGHTGVGLRLAH